MEGTEAPAEAGLSITAHIKSKAEARSEDRPVRVDAVLGHALIAGKQKAGRRIGKLRRPDTGSVVGGAELFDPSFGLDPGNERFPAKAHVQSQATGDVEVILGVQSDEGVAIILELACALLEGADASEEKSRECISRAVRREAERTTRQVGIAQQNLSVRCGHAEDHGMTSANIAEVVREIVVVAIDDRRWKAAVAEVARDVDAIERRCARRLIDVKTKRVDRD